MKVLNGWRLFIFVYFYTTAATVQDSDISRSMEPTELENFVFKDCGGLIYTSTNYFRIEYKLETKLAMSEFCVWVFQPQRGLDPFTISYSDFPTNADFNDGVYVYTWSEMGFQEFELPRNKSKLQLTARVAFVALSTYPGYPGGHGTGFGITVDGKLSFNAANTHFVDEPQGEFKYPLEKAQYDNNDHFALVVQTQKNRNPVDALKYKHIQLVDVDTEEGRDVIEVYELFQYAWQNRGALYPGTTFKKLTSLSGKHDGQVRVTASLTTFPYIVLFKSDKKVTGAGFTVRWGEPTWLK